MTEVAPAGGDTFLVGSSGVIGNGAAASHAVAALQSANRYCASLGKAMEPVATNTTDPAFGRAPAATVQFRCVKQ